MKDVKLSRPTHLRYAVCGDNNGDVYAIFSSQEAANKHVAEMGFSGRVKYVDWLVPRPSPEQWVTSRPLTREQALALNHKAIIEALKP